MSIITYPLDGKYYNAQDAETYLCTRTSGVFSQDISFTPNGMNITVSPFLAWIKNDDFSGKSVAVTTDTTLTISPSEPILSRIDRIVLRFDARKNGSELMVLKGTPSSSPAVPSIERTPVIYDLCLCQISVKPSATSISAGDITSTLLNESLCGIMRDGVTGIPTLQLQSQAQALIRELEVAISMAENGSPVLQSLGIKRGTVDVTIGTEGQKMYISGAVPFDVTFLDTPTVVVSRRIHALNESVYKQIKPQESVSVSAGYFTLNVFSEKDIPTTLTLRYNWIAIGRVAWDNDSGGGGDGGGDGGGEEETGKVTITTRVEPANSGTVTGGGEVNTGSMSAIQANANSEYKFKHWRFENGETNTENPYLFRASADRTFVAVFEVDSGGEETVWEYTVATDGSSIGISAYNGTDENVIIPNTIDGYVVGTVLRNAFSNKTFIKTVTFPTNSSFKTIGGISFSGCTELQSINIPNSVTKIFNSAFDSCDKLTTINYNGTKAEWNNVSMNNAFEDLTDLTVHCTDGDVNYAKLDISVSPEGSGSVTTSPEAVIAMTRETFYVRNSTVDLTATPSSGYNFKHWILPGGYTDDPNPLVTSVSAGLSFTAVFEKIEQTETTYIDDNLKNGVLNVGTQTTNIETDDGYAARTDITQVIIPEGRTRIADNCFSNCSNLTSVTIPVSLTQIGSYAFDYVDKLTDIYYGGTKAQWNAIGIDRVFKTLYNLTVHCSDGSIEYCEVDFVFSPDEGTERFNSNTQINTTFDTSCYVKNSTVTLNATPEDGYSFVRYERSDGVSSTSNPYSFTITRSMTVTVVTERTTTTETAKIYIYSSNAGTGDVVKLTKDEAGTQPWNKNEFSEGETAYFFAQAGTGRIIERLVFKIDNATVADMTADEMVEEGILNSDKNKLSQQLYVSKGQTSEFVATVYFTSDSSGETQYMTAQISAVNNDSSVGDSYYLSLDAAGNQPTSTRKFAKGESFYCYAIAGEGRKITSVQVNENGSVTNYTAENLEGMSVLNANHTELSYPWTVATYELNTTVSFTVYYKATSSGEPTYTSDTLVDGTLYIGTNTTTIGKTHSGNDQITKVVIPDSVTEIGTEAFLMCESLAEVTIGKNVRTIGQSAFSGCYKITEIDIPDSVTSIGDEAFYACEGLKTVIIGTGLTNIGDYAFDACNDIATVKYRGTSSNWNAITIGSNNDDLTRNTVTFI